MSRKNESLKDQLKSISGKPATEPLTERHRKKNPLEGYRFFSGKHHPSKWGDDGVDHINIGAMGATDLGPAMYIGTRLKFVHSELGEFHSLSNFWGYLETNAASERLRFLGTTARIEELERHQRFNVEFISYLILDAAWQRINQLPPLKEAIKETTLPFDNYFVGGSMVARWRRSISHWVIEGYEIMRDALKNDTEPDFSVFMKGKTRSEIMDITIETHGLRRARTQRVTSGFADNRLMAELNALTKAPAAPRRRQELHSLRASTKAPAVTEEVKVREEMPILSPCPAPLVVDEVILPGLSTEAFEMTETDLDAQNTEAEAEEALEIPVVENTGTRTAMEEAFAALADKTN